MNINAISFGSKYLVKGKDIEIDNTNHMLALGAATGLSKNGTHLFCSLAEDESFNNRDYEFDVPDKKDHQIEYWFNATGLKFNKLA